MKQNQLPTCVFLCSGEGSNLPPIFNEIKKNIIPCKPLAIISNSEHAPALDKAKKYSIESIVLPKQDRDTALLDSLSRLKPSFIVLAGYLKPIPEEVILKYPNKILNIHPSLLPKFGGKGMYGIRVHTAVLDAGETTSGATVHIVSGEYDTGKILAQESVPVLSEDTPESLASRVLELEHELYPRAIKKFIESTL